VISLNQRDPGPGRNISSGESGPSNLRLRIVSAAVLAPVVLTSVYVGGWLFLALCVLAACGILWEWTRLVANEADPRILAPGVAALFAAAMLAGLDKGEAAFGSIAIGAILVWGLAAARRPSAEAIWAVGGIIYAGAAFLGPALMRRDPKLGLIAVLFVIAIVWITDTFAYFVGKAIGGPLLWPRLSPKKTWAGAIGGLIGGVAAGTSVAYASGMGRLAVVGAIAFMLSILAQAGDLFESAVKRRFGAKDASNLIPGHGGFMDRLDGFLVAMLAALLIGTVRTGITTPAQGLLIW
jgi:phosphatidate cytidylyltransferase